MSKQDLQLLGDVYGEVLNSLKHSIVRESIKKGGNDLNDPFEKQEGGLDERGGARKALNDNNEDEQTRLDDSCWEDYHKEGTKVKKTKNGNKIRVNNCVPNEDEETTHIKSKSDLTIEKLEKALENPELSEERKKSIREQIAKMSASESEEEKEIKESRKNAGRILNSVMTRKTLSFEKLYKAVLNENWNGAPEDAEDDDLGGLGLDDAQPDDEFSDSGDGEKITVEVGGITISLSKEDAKALHSDLDQQLEGETENEGELEFGDEGEGEDDGYNFGDGEDEEAPAGLTLTGKSNKVTNKVAPKSGKASSEVTDDVETDDKGFGHALYGAKQPNMGTGSNNKVATKAIKPGGDFYR